GERLEVQADVLLHPAVELRLAAGVLDGDPFAGAVLGRPAVEYLLIAFGAALGVALQRALRAVLFAVLGEVELDDGTRAVLVDEFVGVLAAAAVVAEQGVGDGVEHGRLAAAVEAGEHPEGRAVEAHLLLVAVAEEAAQVDTLGNHGVSGSSPGVATPGLL